MTAQPIEPAPKSRSKSKITTARVRKLSATLLVAQPKQSPSPTLAPPTPLSKTKATRSTAKPKLLASPAPDPLRLGTQSASVGGELDTTGHAAPTTQRRPAAGVRNGAEPPPTIDLPEPALRSSGWLELRIWAEMLNDAQKSRIAASNRGERGGVDPEVYRWHVEQLEVVEHGVALAMRRTYRRVVPAEVVAWQKAERGIGEHLLARLLGHLGDPYVATPHAWLETPPDSHVCDPARCGENKHLVAFEPYVRKVSQLWSYCGVGDATRKRRAGMTQADAFGLGSPICKMLIHLLAEACMKQPNGNKYRDVYTAGRAKYATREDWKPGRQHNAALRLVKKELLRDLWLTRHHATGHHGHETHWWVAGGEGLTNE